MDRNSLPADPSAEEHGFDVSTQVFERAAEIFGLLATPVRLRIMEALCRREMNVSELLDLIGVAQPNMSQHLTLLYRAGLVARRRDGSQVYYRVAADVAPLLCDAVHGVTGGLSNRQLA
jgi:ArsR family transcriptional regulator